MVLLKGTNHVQEASAFLEILATPGNTYTFRQAVLLLPDDETDSAAPSYVTSVTGFKPASPKQPTLVWLSSKRKPTRCFLLLWMIYIDGSLRRACCGLNFAYVLLWPIGKAAMEPDCLNSFLP
jgi:hypothetical protein